MVNFIFLLRVTYLDSKPAQQVVSYTQGLLEINWVVALPRSLKHSKGDSDNFTLCPLSRLSIQDTNMQPPRSIKLASGTIQWCADATGSVTKPSDLLFAQNLTRFKPGESLNQIS